MEEGEENKTIDIGKIFGEAVDKAVAEKQEEIEKIEPEEVKRKTLKYHTVKLIKDEVAIQLEKRYEADMQKIKDEIVVAHAVKKELLEIKESIKEDLKLSFENAEYMKSFKLQVLNFVEQEVKKHLSDLGLRDLIKEKMYESVKNDFEKILDTMTSRIVEKLLRKYKKELWLTKDLAMSIDSEIKHIVMRSGMSATMEECFLNNIKEYFDKMENKVSEEQIEQIQQIGFKG